MNKSFVFCLLLSVLLMITSCANQTSSKQSCRDVQVPYEAQEAYTEQEPYTDKECVSKEYDAKGGYIFVDTKGNEIKSNWLIYGLFMTENGVEKPNTDTVQKYYVTNYESKLGSFGIRINYVGNDNKYIESFLYHTIEVGPKETETGNIAYSGLWTNKPGRANGFYISLDKPTFDECSTITKYRTATKYRTTTKYKTETKCD